MIGLLASLAGAAFAWVIWERKVPNWMFLVALLTAAAGIVWQLHRWLTRSSVIGELELRLKSAIVAKLGPFLALGAAAGCALLAIHLWQARPPIRSGEWRELLFLAAGVLAAVALLSPPEIRTQGIAFGGRLITWHEVSGYEVASITSRPALVLYAKPEIRNWQRMMVPIADSEIAAVERIVATHVTRRS